ncbi:sensor histidine kinase [Spongiivirga sp. MCCC 1A20706]|uniref:sensor histidine kinase n=1 Tax=Spongiivirga sp. MCCC 1A20706 TaxID=3160963 RepID=UPI003977C679
MQTSAKFPGATILKHSLFWVGVFLYFALTANQVFYTGYVHLIENFALLVGCQIIATYVILYVFIPVYLDQKKYLLFAFFSILLLALLFAFYSSVRMGYFDVKYYQSYTEQAKVYAEWPFWKRISDVRTFFSKAIKFITPAAILLMLQFYKNQQQFLKLSEQKKAAELNALKNQLNPHFLFNTLNNLYALALEKSNSVPEVIERLSDILDYMLYRCNEKFVSLHKEVELLHNYIALEKIRYGDRVKVEFDNTIKQDIQIAPLLLLTFVENAFTHGVSQALKNATIDISLTNSAKTFTCTVVNSKPTSLSSKAEQRGRDALGLKNVQEQLALLYPNNHQLVISDNETTYSVCLTLKNI